MTHRRRTAVIIAVILVVLAGVTATLLLVRAAEERVTQDLISQVNRFSIPPDWTQSDKTVRPERFLCMSTNPCPSISRRWNAGKELTIDELRTVVSSTGFDMRTEGTCQRQANHIGPTTVCASSGTDGDYEYILNVTSPDATEPRSISLSVRPRG